MDFSDLKAFQAVPRVSGLVLSPDGSRLVTAVAALDPEGKKWTSSLWEVDPAGDLASHRLTRSSKGERSAAFTSGGDLLFCSSRPDPEVKDPEDPSALWLLPAAGGEARVVGTRPGGVGGPVPSRGSDHVVVASDTLPASTDAEDDERRRKARKDAGVSAMLHRRSPVRHWDSDVGPGESRLLLATVGGQWQDLTPAPAGALLEASYDVLPDGSAVVTTWAVQETHGDLRTTLVVLGPDGARPLADDDEHEYGSPHVSPDGRLVAAVRERRSTPGDPPDSELIVVPVDGSAPVRVVAPDWDRWPAALTWLPDGSGLLVVTDDLGRAPVFRVDLDGAVTRLTTDDGAYTDVQVSPDGATAYALRSTVAAPPAPVRFSAVEPGGATPLRGPAEPLPAGRLEEVTTTAADGTPLRAWLALPEGDGPHPLVLFVHGGPLGSWNAWSWRWCPWLLTARGYAVLLPDPSLSTGYGLEHIARGWGDWGGSTYDDVMRTTDAALERPDLDAERTAMMGGSFGGYMANWIAGHTDRFRAIVTHASLWALEQFGRTTDGPWYWRREMTAEMMATNDPSRFADDIVTPLLVIHGDKDYRVPIGEGLALWTALCERAEDPETMPHRFLYFRDESHWVLTPGHAQLWYETVLAFLDQHVLGKPEVVPDLLA